VLVERDHGQSSVGGRESLGFAPAVERHFAFLEHDGLCRTQSEPTLVRYEGNGRYLEVFHGNRSFAVGARFGLIDDADARFSLPEVAYAFGGRYHEFVGRSKEAVDAAVKNLAAEVSLYPNMLNGAIPIDRIQEYRQRLTDYYAGKSKVNPDQQFRKLP
jgi:hypothetical protein